MGIIGSIRKHSGLAVTIVGLAIVAFIIGDLSKNSKGIPEMGKIDGQTISNQQFDQLYREQETNMKQYYGTSQLPAGADYQLREQVWNQLLQETLIGHEMAKLGISVSDEELSDMYFGEFIHPAVRNFFGGQGEYDKMLVKQVLDNIENYDTTIQMQVGQLQKQVREDRAISKYGALMSKSFYMPNAVARKMAELSQKSSDVRVVRVPFTAVSDEEATPTDADIKAYYEEHKNEFKVADEYRQVEYVMFRIVPSQEDMVQIAQEVGKTYEEMLTVEDDELGFFVSTESLRPYDSTYRRASEFAGIDSLVGASAAGSYIEPRIVGNQWVMGKVMATAMRPDSIRASVVTILNSKAGGSISRSEEQAQSLADSVMRLVKGGMDIDTAVMRFSDMKEDLGWALDGTTYGFLNEDIIKHSVGDVFSFERPDKMGVMVVKVTGKTAPAKKYRVAMITRNIEPSNATERKAYQDASLFAGSNRTVAELEAAVREQNLQMGQSDITALSYNLDGHSNVRELVRWAFDKKTKKGEVAEQVYDVEGDAYCVVALKEIYKKGIPTLEQLKADPRFMNYVMLDKKGQILMEKAAQAKGSIDDMAATFGSTVDTMAGVNFSMNYFGRFGAEPRVIGAISANEQTGMMAPVKGYSGVYLVQVDNQASVEASEEEMNIKAATIRAQMEQMAGQKINKIVLMLKENTKVEDNRSLHF